MNRSYPRPQRTLEMWLNSTRDILNSNGRCKFAGRYTPQKLKLTASNEGATIQKRLAPDEIWVYCRDMILAEWDAKPLTAVSALNGSVAQLRQTISTSRRPVGADAMHVHLVPKFDHW